MFGLLGRLPQTVGNLAYIVLCAFKPLVEDNLQMSEESPYFSVHGHATADGSEIAENLVQPTACALCSRVLSLDSPVTGDNDLCGDCKSLCLENLDDPMHDTPLRRTSRRRSRRTSRYRSLESTGDLFSQQFSQMISLMRQNQAASYENEEQNIDGDTSIRSWQQNSSRSTPSGSRRWRHLLSDTESDSYDYMDSLYGESESNISFSHYHTYHGESDAVSISTDGGESVASIDQRSLLSTDILARPNRGSDLDSDTDIDPMHAGLSQWHLDNPEENGEGEEDGDGGWEETDAEDNVVEPNERGAHLGISPNSSGQIDWDELIVLPEFEGVIHLRFRGRTRENSRAFISNLLELDLPSYDGNSDDYLDARGFEELLEHLAENNTSRRGAPPASVSYVNSLPLVTIRKEHIKQQDCISCAICKDTLTVGSEATQLPCFHHYHPSCILPWLSSRNSCPLCRYELPTDDKDYEKSKQESIQRMHDIEENIPQSVVETEAIEENEPNPSDVELTEVSVGGSSTGHVREEGSRGRWLYLAATPIIGLVGMALVLWLGNPLTHRGQAANHLHIFEAGGPRINVHAASIIPRESRSRRWWPLF